MGSNNIGRRSFLRKGTAAGIGSIAVLTATSGSAAAAVDPGYIWSDHQIEKADQNPFGPDYREWIQFEQSLGAQYKGTNPDGYAKFDLLAVHTALYGDNTDAEYTYDDRRSLTDMELKFIGRNGADTIGTDRVESDLVKAYRPKEESEVLANYDISESNLNDAESVKEIDELQQEYLSEPDTLATLTEVGAELAATFGAGIVAALGSYIGAAMLATGTLAGLRGPTENEIYERDGELYKWGYTYDGEQSESAVGVNYYKNLYVDTNDNGVAQFDVEMTSKGKNGRMYGEILTSRDLKIQPVVNFRY